MSQNSQVLTHPLLSQMGMPFFPPNMGFPPHSNMGQGINLPPGIKIHVMRGGPQGGFHSVFNQIQKPPSITKTITITMEQVFSGATIPFEISFKILSTIQMFR